MKYSSPMATEYNSICFCCKQPDDDSTNLPQWTKKGLVVKVVDGDTVDVLVSHYFFPCGWGMRKYRLRIKHLDTPESRTKDEEEKTRGLAAKDFLISLVLGKKVRITTDGRDNFGRILADVAIPSGIIYKNYMLISDIMKEKGHIKAGSKWNSGQPAPNPPRGNGGK
jgi:endonuclease YncB( thermonuclease family)